MAMQLGKFYGIQLKQGVEMKAQGIEIEKGQVTDYFPSVKI